MKLQETFEEYEDIPETNVKDKREETYFFSAEDLEKVKSSKSSSSEFSDNLIPYPTIRGSQKELIQDIKSALENKQHIVAHAPTGLGKTIASIGPALEYCIRNKKTLFFLTSRNTQHIMAIKTLRDIREKFGIKLNVLDIIGKKGMCLQEGIENISGNDFAEFCKHSKKNRTCEYYNNSRGKEGLLKVDAEFALSELKETIYHTEELISHCRKSKVCPYEIALAKGETAQVIIADYYYIFHPDIQMLFFKKTGLSLSDCVVIIDEGHNLPERVKNLATCILTNNILERGMTEASKNHLDEAALTIQKILNGMISLEKEMTSEVDGESSRIVPKDEFNSILEKILPFEKMTQVLKDAGEIIAEKQKRSYINSVLNFIISWQGDDLGFTRIYTSSSYGSKRKLAYECLDPSLISKQTFDKIPTTIVISGTLEPTNMYADLLGIQNCVLKSYRNPFPQENALSIIVPKTTTKYTRRTPEEYNRIAEECAKIIDTVPGNLALFFPSYDVRDKIYRFLRDLTDKEFVIEKATDSKEEKALLIKSFTRPSLTGRVLLGTSSGSFGEGIDLPGHFLNCVVVIGLPLKKPTLEIQELIKYYDFKFGKGWDYGYFFPSFNKTFQNVGRCIRSERDRGVMIYLDERFAEKRYLRFFGNRKVEISLDYIPKIKAFYKISD